jgi:type I restriction enzyme, S subunit
MSKSCSISFSWRELRLRFLLNNHRSVEENNRLNQSREVTFLPMEAVSEHGELDLSIIRQKDEVEKGYTLFFDNDVLVAKITPCFENGKGALAHGLFGGVGYGTTELYVLNSGSDLLPKFLFYVTISDEFRINGEAAMKGAAGQKRVPNEFIQNFKIRLPQLDIQQKITDYLDRETTEIDALIAEKEHMLTLLEEKREALISHAVTRGLDPGVPMKPSGLDWIGDIPQHWKLERAKNLFSVRDERSKTGDEELLSVSHITGVTSRAEKQVYMFKAEDMTGYKRCMKEDFITNTLWAWMGAMGISPLDGIVSPDYHVYVFKGDLLPEFMELLCRSKPFIAEVMRWSKGVWSSRLRLYPENFFEIQFPVPPKSEQQDLITKIEEEDGKNRELKKALTDSIVLLRERRSSLITAAVTGQIAMENMVA